MRTRFALLLAALVLAVVAGVAVASALVPTSDPPVGPERVEPDSSAPVLRAATDDPGDLQRWAVRRYQSKDGAACAEVGRIQDGAFGRVDSDRTFHRLDLDADGTGSCGPVDDDHPYTFAVSHYPATGKREALAAIFGVASAEVQTIALKLSDRTEQATIDHGSFLLVLPDEDLVNASAVFQLTDGTTETKPLHSMAALVSARQTGTAIDGPGSP
jgi:hypothetical protein